MSLLVARIGDGLAATPHLKVWLDALAAWPGSLAIAPGGGPFGAAARSASEAMGLNAVVAQKIALMAMDQYAVALAAVRPSPVIAETEDELRAAIASRRIAVWAPARMIAAASDIPATSEISSDSLAAWLAGKLGAAHLLLIEDNEAPTPVSTAWLAKRAMPNLDRGAVGMSWGGGNARAWRIARRAGDCDARDLIPDRVDPLPSPPPLRGRGDRPGA